MIHIGVIGATGLVGREVIFCLQELPQYQEGKIIIYPYASVRSVGETIGKLTIQELKKSEQLGEDLDYAILAISKKLSREYTPLLIKNKCRVIDNSNAFRMKVGIPLVVPEVNLPTIKETDMIIANPNCSTIITSLVAYPLHQKAGINRMVISTYQAVSGAGVAGMRELIDQINAWSKGDKLEKKKFSSQTLLNVFTHDSPIEPYTLYTEEELKMVNETIKILQDPKIKVSVTCLRVPVFRSHTISLTLTLTKPLSLLEVIDVLKTAPGVKIEDDIEKHSFPEPIKTENQKDVWVGRIREDIGQEKGYGYQMLISGDQILKGAAWNAVQILNHLAFNK